MGSRSIASPDAFADVAKGLRIGARLALLLLALVVMAPLHYLWRLLGQGSPWPQLFLGIAAWLCGARVRIVGVPLRRDVFFVANHVSWLDILVMGGASGSAFVSKSEVRDTPVVGWLAGLNRTVYVERGDRLGIGAQIDRLREALAENWAVTVFPEGTTGDGAALLPFKPALLQVLEPPPPGVRVQPVLIDYGAATSAIAWTGDEPGKDNALKLLARPGSFEVIVRFLEPFAPSDHPGRKAIAAEARRRILTAQGEKPGLRQAQPSR